MLFRELNTFTAIGGFSDNAEALLPVEQRAQPVADHGVIVSQQYANGRHLSS